jgi:hypothetical protein
MQLEIIDKLDKFLKLHNPFSEDYHAVYFMVETRKILEHENNNTYRFLKFFADWSVHTKKDRTRLVKLMAEDIYREIRSKGSSVEANPKLVDFTSMKAIKIRCRLIPNKSPFAE